MLRHSKWKSILILINCYGSKTSEEKLENLNPTYRPGITYCNLNELFPNFINKTLKEGLKYFGTKL